MVSTHSLIQFIFLSKENLNAKLKVQLIDST